MIINLAKIRFGGSGGSSPAKPEDFFEETYTANGDYDVVPQTGHVFSGGTITVAVPSDQKPEDEFTELYEANGVYDITPESGHVFSAGQIEVDVHPTDKLTRTYTENDTYEISGEWTDAEITVAVPVPTEETLSETITENGLHTFTPTEGSVFSSVEIEADVHPENSLSLTITESGSYTSSDEFSGYEINVDVEGPKTEETLTETITTNGTQIFTPTAGSVFDSAVITVNVPGITPTGTININANGTYDVTDKATAIVAVGGTDYRYKTGTPDTIGLAAIGWTADDIGYYGANTPHYAWENGNYSVSQENINLYSLDDPQPSLYKNDPLVTFVPNKNMSTYFGTLSVTNMKYIKSIPLFSLGSRSSLQNFFYDWNSLQVIPPLDTSNVTSMASMFYRCSSLQVIPLLDTSNVTSMEETFYKCSSLTSIPLLDTGRVTNMEETFCDCSSLKTIPLLDTSSATNMRYMFSGCKSLTSIPALDTSSATRMDYMFSECSALASIPALDTSSVTNMANMFYGCGNLASIPALDTSSVTDVRYLFYNCSSLTSIPALDTSSVTNMSYMFATTSNLTEVLGIDFSGLTSNLTSLFGFDSSKSKLTHFIVNGKINVSISDSYSIKACINLDYDSIKSILEAANRTDNVNAKTLAFNTAAMDLDGELTALVTSCATKGWTITGLVLYEEEIIESITPSKDHITVSNIAHNYGDYVTLSVNSRVAWQSGGQPKQHGTSFGIQYDYYDADTDELTREGTLAQVGGAWTPGSGSIGETVLTPNYGSWAPSPQSGEYALVGISFRTNTSPYMYYDYYFKVYPDGE